MIDDKEWMDRCEIFFSVYHENSNAPRSAIVEMFALYNDRITPRENGSYCASCAGRVFKKLKKEYDARRRQD